MVFILVVAISTSITVQLYRSNSTHSYNKILIILVNKTDFTKRKFVKYNKT